MHPTPQPFPRRGGHQVGHHVVGPGHLDANSAGHLAQPGADGFQHKVGNRRFVGIDPVVEGINGKASHKKDITARIIDFASLRKWWHAFDIDAAL